MECNEVPRKKQTQISTNTWRCTLFGLLAFARNCTCPQRFLTNSSSPPPTAQRILWAHHHQTVSVQSSFAQASTCGDFFLPLMKPDSFSRKWIKVHLSSVKPSLAPCSLSYLHFFVLTSIAALIIML